jgi:putative spermidine/putrescine transport system ATP-binding protein
MVDVLPTQRSAPNGGFRPASGAVRIDDVTKRYGDAVAVDRVSLDIRQGEFLTLLGASGSGKSTLLNLIAGFVTPDAGRVLLDGADLAGVRPHRRNMGVMFQNYALFPHLTVEANVAYPLQQRKVRRAEIRRRVADVLDLVQLGQHARRLPLQLSGGQQQRVALARSIVFEPPVLLLDEPMGALDKSLRESLQYEMKAIHERLGITFVQVTHDQSEALAMSDRIAVLHSGRVEQVGTPHELYYRPQTRRVAEFMGESNLFEGRTDGADGLMSIRDDDIVIVAPNELGFAANDRVTVSIRPEHIRLVGEGSGSPAPTHHGHVTEMAFLGSHRRLTVRLASGRDITVLEPASSAAEPLQPGAPARVTWQPADVIVLPKESPRGGTDLRSAHP